MAENIRGYLVINVEEASGKTQRDQFTWDTNNGNFEAFIKVEIRGGPRGVKAQSKKAPLVGDTITWREQLTMEVLEGCSELRIMLCREKFQGSKRGTSVVAACGIYVSDILEAVPIDKYFELFKPNAGGEGGFVRISMNFVKDLSELKKQDSARNSIQPSIAFGTQPTNSRDVAGRLQGVVSPDVTDEVAKRVATIGTAEDEQTATGPAKKKKGAKKFILPFLVLTAATIAGAVLKKRS